MRRGKRNIILFTDGVESHSESFRKNDGEF